RIKIASEPTAGVDWGLEIWHRVRVERRLADGTIRVFFDDLSKPIMVASDRHFDFGRVGFGSFDDTGKVARVRIWGPEVLGKRLEFFDHPGR
ncbi:MAG: hypothetical protein ACYDC1_25650, partial [Limisphaerales bacterium]